MAINAILKKMIPMNTVLQESQFGISQKSGSTFPVASLAVLTTIAMLGISTPSQAAANAEVLQPGHYVENLNYKRYTEPYVLQRLTDRTYMVSVSTHNATFYVSDSGVILFDPLSNGFGKAVMDAISTVTDLPITALVYSHYHLDHLGDSHLFVDNAKKNGVDLRIIASAAVAEQVGQYGNVIPAPTDVIEDNPGSFNFDGLTVRVELANDTHSIDNTMYLLEQEKVLHYLDAIEPEDLLPYFRLVGVLDIAPLENALLYAKTLDWEFLNAGHSNIGSRKDIDQLLELISDIRNATGASMGEVPFDQFINPKADVLVWVNDYHEAVADRALEKLSEKYGKHPRFDAVMRSHVEVMTSNISYYNPH